MNEQNAAQQSEDRIPAGNYEFVCTGEVQYGKSSGGKEQIGIELDLQGTLVTAILYFSPSARPFSIPKLKACGWSGSGDIGPQIRGKTVRGSIKYESYTKPETGETTRNMKVEIYDGGGSLQFKEKMTDSEKSNFLASLSQNAPAQQPGGYPASWDQKSDSERMSASTLGAPGMQPNGRFSLGK